MITVAVFLQDQAYGGPEEGGWWFDTFLPETGTEFAEHIRHFPDTDKGWDKAHEWRAQLQEFLDAEYNAFRPPLHSVNSKGVFTAVIVEGYELKPMPETIPHYE